MTKFQSQIAPQPNSLRFNLTSAAGLAAVAAFLVRGGASIAAISPAAPIAIPIVALLAFYEFKKRGQRNKIVNEPQKSVHSLQMEQQAVAVAILEKGRELGFSEVEIILEGDAGVEAGIQLPKALNVDLRLKTRRSTKTTIRAKYNDTYLAPKKTHD
jgi:hypothetical protein